MRSTVATCTLSAGLIIPMIHGAHVKSILFVCPANHFRSPMAEALFSDLVCWLGEGDEWQFTSGGVWAYGGAPATESARRVMEECGLNLRAHRS
jgi:protein-tyrosine-phosphatase